MGLNMGPCVVPGLSPIMEEKWWNSLSSDCGGCRVGKMVTNLLGGSIEANSIKGRAEIYKEHLHIATPLVFKVGCCSVISYGIIYYLCSGLVWIRGR